MCSHTLKYTQTALLRQTPNGSIEFTHFMNSYKTDKLPVFFLNLGEVKKKNSEQLHILICSLLAVSW